MNINKGDKVRMIKDANYVMEWFGLHVGDEFIVDEVKNGGLIKLRNEDRNVACTLYPKFVEEHFEKVNEVYYDIEDNDFDYIAEILSESNFRTTSVFGKCTIVACQLPNGFVIVESSSCVDPDDYDEEIGIENCMNRIKNKVIELEAYCDHFENRSTYNDERTDTPCPYEDCDACPCNECH